MVVFCPLLLFDSMQKCPQALFWERVDLPHLWLEIWYEWEGYHDSYQSIPGVVFISLFLFSPIPLLTKAVSFLLPVCITCDLSTPTACVHWKKSWFSFISMSNVTDGRRPILMSLFLSRGGIYLSIGCSSCLRLLLFLLSSSLWEE